MSDKQTAVEEFEKWWPDSTTKEWNPKAVGEASFLAGAQWGLQKAAELITRPTCQDCGGCMTCQHRILNTAATITGTPGSQPGR